jgi:hypothetical protein
MMLSQDSIQKPEEDPSKLQDEFASGPSNRPRRWVVRLVDGLFRPPFLPPELNWLLLALITSTLAVELLVQPASYWTDPSLSKYYSFLGVPLQWGVGSLGIHIAFILLVGMVLFLINRKPAFILWIALAIYHLLSLTNSFRCGTTYFFFETSQNCSDWHSAGLLSQTLIVCSSNFYAIFCQKSKNVNLPKKQSPEMRKPKAHPYQ